MGESDSVATVARAIASSPRQASLTARTPRRAGVARRSPLFNPSCRPAALPPWRPADLPTADLLARRPATCRPAQLPTCRLASWPTAASTSPTMTVRAMAIAITHATATTTANGGPYMDNISEPCGARCPPDPRFNIGGYGKQGGWRGQKCSNPQVATHPKLNIDMGGRGGSTFPPSQHWVRIYCPCIVRGNGSFRFPTDIHASDDICRARVAQTM